MFKKYNSILRGLGSEKAADAGTNNKKKAGTDLNHWVFNTMVKLCCKEADARKFLGTSYEDANLHKKAAGEELTHAQVHASQLGSAAEHLLEEQV